MVRGVIVQVCAITFFPLGHRTGLPWYEDVSHFVSTLPQNAAPTIARLDAFESMGNRGIRAE
jgi:hypothetical protein